MFIAESVGFLGIMKLERTCWAAYSDLQELTEHTIEHGCHQVGGFMQGNPVPIWFSDYPHYANSTIQTNRKLLKESLKRGEITGAVFINEVGNFCGECNIRLNEIFTGHPKTCFIHKVILLSCDHSFNESSQVKCERPAGIPVQFF